MNKKLFFLVMLAMVLVFGMTAVGCEEDNEVDDNPSTPTGLAGTADSSTSIKLTWNSVSNAGEYWIQYKKNSSTVFLDRKEGISSTSVTITGLVPVTKYDFQVAVKNKDGYVSSYSSIVSVETLSPSTGSVSIRLGAYESYLSGSSRYSYIIATSLTLSDGTNWTSSLPPDATGKAWITVTGIDLTGWTFDSSVYADGGKSNLMLRYTLTQAAKITMPGGGITVSIDQTKLSEMKGYTNASNSITIGSPASASASAWTN
jgi:chitodextrinase